MTLSGRVGRVVGEEGRIAGVVEAAIDGAAADENVVKDEAVVNEAAEDATVPVAVTVAEDEEEDGRSGDLGGGVCDCGREEAER